VVCKDVCREYFSRRGPVGICNDSGERPGRRVVSRSAIGLVDEYVSEWPRGRFCSGVTTGSV